MKGVKLHYVKSGHPRQWKIDLVGRAAAAIAHGISHLQIIGLRDSIRRGDLWQAFKQLEREAGRLSKLTNKRLRKRARAIEQRANYLIDRVHTCCAEEIMENIKGLYPDYFEEDKLWQLKGLCGPDFDEPDVDDSSGAQDIWRLYSQEDGTIKGHWWTNDNDDDGWPGNGEDEIASGDYEFECIDAALSWTHGGTHNGVSGIEVLVYLDGCLIHTTWTKGRSHENPLGHPEYLPYCEYNGPRRRRDD